MFSVMVPRTVKKESTIFSLLLQEFPITERGLGGRGPAFKSNHSKSTQLSKALKLDSKQLLTTIILISMEKNFKNPKAYTCFLRKTSRIDLCLLCLF